MSSKSISWPLPPQVTSLLLGCYEANNLYQTHLQPWHSDFCKTQGSGPSTPWSETSGTMVQNKPFLLLNFFCQTLITAWKPISTHSNSPSILQGALLAPQKWQDSVWCHLPDCENASKELWQASALSFLCHSSITLVTTAKHANMNVHSFIHYVLRRYPPHSKQFKVEVLWCIKIIKNDDINIKTNIRQFVTNDSFLYLKKPSKKNYDSSKTGAFFDLLPSLKPYTVLERWLSQ